MDYVRFFSNLCTYIVVQISPITPPIKQPIIIPEYIPRIPHFNI